MKSKYFLFIVIIACIAGLAGLKPAGEGGMRLMDYEEMVCSISDQTDDHLAVLCEADVNFSPATTKVSHHEHTKNYEKQFKYKLPVKENLKIELSVENYIFYIESLADRYTDLSKLRRLNI